MPKARCASFTYACRAFSSARDARPRSAQSYVITTAGSPSPTCYAGTTLFGVVNVQSFAIDCKSTPGNSTSGTISAWEMGEMRGCHRRVCAGPRTTSPPSPRRAAVGLCVLISVGLAVLILYWVWQDRVAKKKVVDTTGTVAHYQALEAAEKGGH